MQFSHDPKRVSQMFQYVIRFHTVERGIRNWMWKLVDVLHDVRANVGAVLNQ